MATRNVTREPLPERWVDLIHYDEQRRREQAEAELPVTNQEKLLREWSRTEEPTSQRKATARP
jgi:hypothetical protein